MIDQAHALSLLQLLEDSITAAHDHLDDEPEAAALELFDAEQHLAELRMLVLGEAPRPTQTRGRRKKKHGR